MVDKTYTVFYFPSPEKPLEVYFVDRKAMEHISEHILEHIPKQGDGGKMVDFSVFISYLYEDPAIRLREDGGGVIIVSYQEPLESLAYPGLFGAYAQGVLRESLIESGETPLPIPQPQVASDLLTLGEPDPKPNFLEDLL